MEDVFQPVKLSMLGSLTSFTRERKYMAPSLHVAREAGWERLWHAG